MTTDTLTADYGVTPDTVVRYSLHLATNRLVTWVRLCESEQGKTMGMGVNLSETPIPIEDGVLRKRLGRLVHACPVDTPVGNNPLGLTLHKLKRADTSKPLLVVGEKGVVVVRNSSHVAL